MSSTNWTLIKFLAKNLLIATLNVSWNNICPMKNNTGNLLKIMGAVCERQMWFNGHCWRSKEVVHQLILWDPNYRERSRGMLARAFINQLIDTRIRKEELSRNIGYRNGWEEVVRSACLMMIKYSSVG